MLQNEILNPKMFALGREARGYSQSDLAQLSGVGRTNISRFENDGQELSEDFLTRIVDTLKFSETLYKVQAELLPPATYRKQDSIKVKVVTQVDAMINIYAFGIRNLLTAMRFEDLNVPSYLVSQDQSAEQAAAFTRKAWKMPKGEITNLTTILEANGFITMPVNFGTDHIDSRSILIDDKYPVIFYNKKLRGDRLRFTLAYELGHIVMHTRSSLVRFDNSHEANVFAAEFLMPKDDITKDLHAKIDLEDLAQLKNKWLVSMQAILYRAEDLGVITENHKRYIINRFNKMQILKREPKELDIAIERGQLLRDLITKYRSRQKMNVKQIAAFFYMREEEFLFTFN